MSETTQTAPDDLAEQVRALFANAREVLPADRSTADDSEGGDELSDAERAEVRDLGSEAADLLETSDPEALLAALGMGGSDGPGSIPAAILAGDPDDVADLRVLLALSRLAPDEDGDGTFDEQERTAMATLVDLLGDGSAGEAESVETTDDDSETADGEAAGADGDAGDEEADAEAAEDETDAAESEDEGDEITSTLQDALADVQSGLGDAFESDDADDADEGGGDDGLVEAAGDFVDEASGRIADAATGEDGGAGEGATDADTADQDADSEDEGFLGLGDEGDVLDSDEDGGTLGGEDSPRGRQSVGGFGRAKLSTIPAQDRADMSGVRRYSTMPKR